MRGRFTWSPYCGVQLARVLLEGQGVRRGGVTLGVGVDDDGSGGCEITGRGVDFVASDGVPALWSGT